MPTDCNAGQLLFEGFEGRQVVGAFDGGAVTSNAGATLLREADRAIGLTAKAARSFRDGRAAELVVHNIETLVAQRVHAIALGYEDTNDHDELRHDPVLGLLSDTLEPKRADVATLAGKSTLNRLEHAIRSAHSVEAGRGRPAGSAAGSIERLRPPAHASGFARASAKMKTGPQGAWEPAFQVAAVAPRVAG